MNVFRKLSKLVNPLMGFGLSSLWVSYTAYNYSEVFVSGAMFTCGIICIGSSIYQSWVND